MIVKFTEQFHEQYKKVDRRIKKSFEQGLTLFIKNPMDLQLKNHPLLREPYLGQRSINITSDYRAIYKSEDGGEEVVIYFTALGTHKQLYQKLSID